MGSLLLMLIRTYWALVPEQRRSSCLFRTSCSRHVYRETSDHGLYKGLKTLWYRYQNCRGGYQMIEHPGTGKKILILPKGGRVAEDQIARRLL